MTRELDERQEALHRIDTLATRPLWIAPSRHKRRSRWARFVLRLKAIALRPRRS